MLLKRLSLLFLTTFIALSLNAQTKKYDLLKVLTKNGLTIHNRQLTPADEKKHSVKFSEAPGEGIAWINNVNFTQGTIEIDLKGKDEFQKSFVGVAFHATNDSTYEAVYFRPFNFFAKDSIRKIHAVQYISHPTFGWKKLRDERNGIFEKSVTGVADPNDWFHARIVVNEKKVWVYVNSSNVPVLSVDRLSNQSDGKIGIWVGDGAGGEFANLQLTTRK